MKYTRFEQLPVWQAALDLAERIFRLTDHAAFRRKGDLANQLERAALSVSNNVAEGFERGTTTELIAFLYYARGSAGEVRSMLHLCARLRAGEQLHQAEPLRAGEQLRQGERLQPSQRISGSEDEHRTSGSQSDLKSEISNLISLAESVSRQLRAWADSLQNSDIPGQRHLTDRSRAVYEHKQHADAFWRQLDDLRSRGDALNAEAVTRASRLSPTPAHRSTPSPAIAPATVPAPTDPAAGR